MANDNNNDGIFVNLTVPPGVEAGVDSLTFEYCGNELDILIPAGSVAGDVLRIQVGGADDDGDGGDDAGEKEDESKPKSSLMDELGGTNDSDDQPTAQSSNDRKRPAGDLMSTLGGLKTDEDGCSLDRTKNLPAGNATAKNITSSAADGITTVELGNGCTQESDTNGKQSTITTLHLLESLPTTDKSEGGNNNNNDISNEEGDGTHGMVWASGTLLAQALTSSFGLKFLSSRLFQLNNTPHKMDSGNDRNCNVNCLELGSGLGVCGLALAHALSSCNKSHSTKGVGKVSANIVLTDQGEDAIALLRANIQRNLPPSICSSKTNDQCISIDAESLVWGNALPTNNRLHSNEKKVQLILGSDLLYNTQESYEPLITTIKQHLHPNGMILLAVRWRKPDLERDFFQRAEKNGLEFELWQEFMGDEEFGKRSPCKLSWKDYGNPECEPSNGYFHETMVSIAKKEKTSLAEVAEKDMECMNDEEYSTFEELQVQIYIGKLISFDEEDDNARSGKMQPRQDSSD